MTVRIVLADDHALVRAGIRALLQAIEGVAVVAEAENGRDALALCKEHKPDLAILDITMQELNGIDAAAQVKAACPATRVLILSMHSSEEFVRRAIKSGANGYLVKDAAPLELAMAVQAVMRDEVYLSPRVSRHVVAGMREAADGEPRRSSLDTLSARQREILQMIAEGKSTKEIAFVLDVSVKTVETHRAAIMERVGIRDVPGLVVYAIRNGLIHVER
ncbi:MAG TPA: response regulator transcription factor [Usitatibacter sp.]|jgi:DNA-binding NarL/FixJ family response regulator|nr:response regulator transcription factor [Usitatibacter sp.]